jgi:hypothetical protein
VANGTKPLPAEKDAKPDWQSGLGNFAFSRSRFVGRALVVLAKEIAN